MIKVECKSCGKSTMWDDFGSPDFRCPKCGVRLNIHSSFKDNVEKRVYGVVQGRKRCPDCYQYVDKLWFAKCPHCKQWLFGKHAFSGKWFVAFLVLAGYSIVSLFFLFM